MYQKTVLHNGISLITERSQSRTVSFGIWIDVGSRDEDHGMSGCAHFVEHMLFKGTTTRDAAAIARELDRLGGQANAFTSKEHTCLYGTVLDKQLPQLVALLSDLFLLSLYPEHEVERERSVIVQEIGMVQDTPEDLAHDLFAEILWAGHPLGRPVLGEPEAIATMTRARLKKFMGQGYIPSRVLISAAGNVEHEALVTMLAAVSAFAATTVPAEPAPARQAPAPLPAKIIVQPKRLEQAHVLLGTYGLPANSEARYALALLSTILGGNMSSRLFQEVREKRGLAYSIYSFVDAASDSGVVGIYAGIGHEAVNEVMALISVVIGDICAGGITDDELRGAQDFARAGIYLAEESMEARMMRLAKNELTLGRYVPIEEVEFALSHVGREELMSLATDIFAKPLSGVILGPVRTEDYRPDASLFAGEIDDD
jgi:predicted Zn-dependent peptidase